MISHLLAMPMELHITKVREFGVVAFYSVNFISSPFKIYTIVAIILSLLMKIWNIIVYIKKQSLKV